MALTSEQRQKIIKMYRDGHKTSDITETVGVARSSIYFVLKDEGIMPTRQRAGGTSAIVPRSQNLTPSEHSNLLDWALRRVTELEQENGALRERVRIGRVALME